MSPYIGRFAPTASGPLHAGSLFAALVSYLDAKAAGGKWLVRIEDIDRARCQPKFAAAILRDLEHFGLLWDGEVIYQSERLALYRDYFSALREQDLVYPCFCSRRELRHRSRHVKGELVYNGHCRDTEEAKKSNKTPSWRIRVPDRVITCEDDWLGVIRQNLARDVGDFIIRRADGCYAYQFVVVIDDFLQGVTHVVRGKDLLFSTPRQIYLGGLLHFPLLHYRHFGLLLDYSGEKLAKRKGTPAPEQSEAIFLLQSFLRVLFPGEEIPFGVTAHELLAWATHRWQHTAPPTYDVLWPEP